MLWALSAREAPSNDASTYVAVARSVALSGTLALDYPSPGYTVDGPDGRAYGKYPLPWSLALAPEAWIERLVSTSDLAMPDKDLYVRLVRGVTPAAAGAAAVVLLFAALAAGGVPRRRALLLSIAFHLATFALPYLKSHYSEAMQVATVNLALLAMARVRAAPSPRAAALLGLAAGLLVLAKVTLALFAVAAVAGALAVVPPLARRDWRLWASGIAASLVPLALFAWYNDLRWGEPFVTRYAGYLVPERLGHPFHEGLYGLLLSPGRGLLWYAPLAVTGLVGAARCVVRDRGDRLTLAVAAGIAATLAFHSCWTIWHGAEQWGPRFLVTMTGPLAWCATPVIAALVERRPGRAALGLLVAAGLLVNLPAALVSPQRLYSAVPYRPYSEIRLDAAGRPTVPIEGDNLDRVNFSPRFSPILGQAWLVQHALFGGEPASDAPWRDSLSPGEPVVRTAGFSPRLDLWFVPDDGWPAGTRATAWVVLAILLATAVAAWVDLGRRTAR